MPYPVNINSLEIKLFYQIYGEKNSKPDEEEYFDADDEDELENLETLLQTEQTNLDFQDQQNDSTPTSFIKSLFDTAWECANYAYNHPFQTFTLILAAYAAANTHCLFENIFEAQEQFSNSINTATNILTKLAVAKIANGMQPNTPFNTIIVGMSLWNPVAATTPEFLVNTYTTSSQGNSAIASLPDGRFVVAWTSYGQDGPGNDGVYGQRFNGTGAKIGPEFLINTYTTNSQSLPYVASFADNSFVVTWQSYGQDGSGEGVYGQRFNATAAKVGTEFQVNTYTTDWQRFSSIASFVDGSFVVTWEDDGQEVGQEGAICGQRFNAMGAKLGAEFLINTYTTYYQTNPSVASFVDGSFVVTWQSTGQGEPFGHSNVYAQRFNPTAAKIGAEFLINTYTTNKQNHPSVASFVDGSFVVTWGSLGQDGPGDGVYGQRFNPTGVKIGAEFQINTYTTSIQSLPSVASFTDGSFVVTWDSLEQDGSEYGIYGQRFNATGAKVGTEFQINTYTTSSQFSPAVACFADSSFVVTWSSYQDGEADGVYARIFTPPNLGNNRLIINEGETRLLTNTILNASAPKTDPGTLLFVVSNVTHGKFEFVNNTGIPIFNFTQQQIINGQVQFVHDGSKFKPSYYVKVNEVVLDTNFEPATIIFNFSPTLNKNDLTIQEGQTILVTSNYLNATDLESFAGTLVFNIQSLTHGQFELVSNPGFPIFNFTQQHIFNNNVRFVHDGGEIAPAYNVTVSDDFLTTLPFPANITFIHVDDVPVLVRHQLTITEGQSVLINSANLNATDVDNSAGSLIFNIVTLSDGQFQFVNNPGIAIFNFAQQQIFNNNVRFIHDGSEVAPAFNVTVSDGSLTTTPVPALITFIKINDAPVLSGTENEFIFKEKELASSIYITLTLSDVDSTTITNATVFFSQNFTAGEDILGFSTRLGITGVYDGATGALQLTGITTVANYEAALRTVTYFNPSSNPSTAIRVVSFVVHDGMGVSNLLNTNIIINPINDAPVLSSSETGTLLFTQQNAELLIHPSISLIDVDNLFVTNANISVTNNFVSGEDYLIFANQSGITGSFNSTTGILSLTGSASIADYQIALRSVKYNNPSANPSSLTRIISFTINDGEKNSNTLTRQINVALAPTPTPTPIPTPTPTLIPTPTPTPILAPTPTPITADSIPTPTALPPTAPTPTQIPMSDPTPTVQPPIETGTPIKTSPPSENDRTIVGMLTAAGATIFLSALGLFGYRKIENAKEVKESVDNITQVIKPSYSPGP